MNRFRTARSGTARLGTVRRRVGAALAMASALTVVLTVGVHPTFASWVNTAKLGDSVGVASSSCTTPGVYRTTAASRFLAGSVAGVPLATTSALAPLTADNDATTVTFPSGAAPQGGDGATSAVANSAVATAVQAAGGMAALTAPAGSQTQYAAATSTGRSVAGSGAVTASGAIDTAGIAGGTRAAFGTVDVSSVLAAVPGGAAARGSLSQLGLTVGNAASTSTLNECARRWGASLSSALTRSATLSSASLTAKDTAVTGLLSTVAAKQVDASTSFGAIATGAQTAIAATASSGLVNAVDSALSSLPSAARASTPSATVTVTPDLSGAVTAAAASRSSGPASLNGSTGVVTVDLSGLAGSTSPQPNTSVLTGADATAVATGVSAAAGSLVTAVGSSWDSAAADASVTITVSVPITLAGAQLASVSQTVTAAAGDLAAGTATWPPPQVTVLNTLSATSLLAALTTPLQTQLIGPIAATVQTELTGKLSAAVTTARSALTTGLATARAALPTDFATLSTLFSITLNEQPDVTPFPSGVAGMGTAGYRVTALRVHVKVAGADALDLGVANTSVGPDRTLNQ